MQDLHPPILTLTMDSPNEKPTLIGDQSIISNNKMFHHLWIVVNQKATSLPQLFSNGKNAIQAAAMTHTILLIVMTMNRELGIVEAMYPDKTRQIPCMKSEGIPNMVDWSSLNPIFSIIWQKPRFWRKKTGWKNKPTWDLKLVRSPPGICVEKLRMNKRYNLGSLRACSTW